MMADAALGVIFGELLKAVADAKGKAAMFKNVLERMQSTLNSINPIVQEIEKLNEELNRRKEEIAPLMGSITQGQKLVLKCSKINWWNCIKKCRYTDELNKLEKSLKDIIKIFLQVQNTRDIKQTLVEVKDIHREIKEVKNIHREKQEVKDIDKGMEEVTDTPKAMEEVKDIRKGIEEEKDTRRGMERVKINFRENHDKDNLSEKGGFISSCTVPEPPVLTVGLDVPFQDLKKKLLNDGVSMIVLSAPGGYGKTTLAKKLCHDQQVERKFKDNIFFVTVSKTFNLKVIVQKLFQHKGYQVPEFQSDEDVVNHSGQLLKRIGPNPILLVLDDVWSGSESLLEKFRFQLPDYKILVTSRSTFPRFDSTCSLRTLNDEEAMTLFCHSAFQQDGSSHIPDEVLRKIVKGCKGLPLVLTVIGRSLCGQPAAVWQNTLMEWSKGGSIFDSHKELLNCLQSSLDALDSKPIVKECYFDLGSFPQNQMIPATALIDMWVELYGQDEDGVSSIANLHELYNRNLIDLIVTKKDDSGVDGYYNDHFIMQHDLLRELVNHQSNLGLIESRKRLIVDISGNQFPEWWMEQKQQPICACLLSISTDEMFSSNWYNMQVPEVKVLVLNFRTKNYTLPKFIDQMRKLKVLIVSNCGFFPAELTNFSLLGSLSNLKRIRLEQVSIPSLSLTNVQLKNLKKISLVICSIGQAFTNIQISYAFPNLVEINIDYCNDLVELPDGLCDIVHLKKLNITYCHKLRALSQEIGKLVNLEVLRLSSCINLLEFPDTIGSLYKLSILDISDCSSIKKLPKQFGKLHNLKKLFMKGCSSELSLSVVNLKLSKDVICD